tara:strand:- start:939 stop:1133 length:195 start_codon:yes stop_codon:yes gene_type:complete
MKVTVDLKYFIPAILAFIISYMTITEKIDNYITFAGELNALFFFLMSTMLGGMLLIGAFTPDKK